MAAVIEKFVQEIRVSNAILYMQDFGGPVGMRLATKHPEWVRGIVIQNTLVSLDDWEPSRLKAIQVRMGSCIQWLGVLRRAVRVLQGSRSLPLARM